MVGPTSNPDKVRIDKTRTNGSIFTGSFICSDFECTGLSKFPNYRLLLKIFQNFQYTQHFLADKLWLSTLLADPSLNFSLLQRGVLLHNSVRYTPFSPGYLLPIIRKVILMITFLRTSCDIITFSLRFSDIRWFGRVYAFWTKSDYVGDQHLCKKGVM